MSGIELESPHKLAAAQQQFPCTIAGIGEVKTSWIGERGVEEIQKHISEEQVHSEVRVLANELKVLAAECLNAFESAGLLQSNEPQVCRAIELCHSYLPGKPASHNTPTGVSTISTLWKEESSQRKKQNQPATKSLATAVLGEKLVATLTEEKQQPPDVSL